MQKIQEFDVLVVGAGVAGCCLARELSRFDLSCVVLEAGNDVAYASSRANSGIVHAGFDPIPGSKKAEYCASGARLFASWQEELEFGYIQNGSLVLAFSEDELNTLHLLKERGDANGVFVELLSVDELRALEPAVSPEAIAALHAPTAGICDPYGLAFAAAENAAENGVVFLFGKQVEKLERTSTGFLVHTPDEVYSCKKLVNAAGVYADELNNILSSNTLHITPVRGDYMLYDTPYGTTFSHTMFQAPGAMGKGILITPTVHGNLLIGPNAIPQESKSEVSTSAEGLEFVLSRAKKTWPGASRSGIITNFSGLRAKGANGDFVIGEAEDVPGFYTIACFESPGLTASPAVAAAVAKELAASLAAHPRAGFNPRRVRSGQKLFALMDDDERKVAVAENPDHGQMVCRCCSVTKADLVYELESSVLPVLCLDALKWRTGAMMGRCHAGFCAPEIMQIVYERTGLLPENMDKRLPDSPFVVASSEAYSELVGTSAALSQPPSDTSQPPSETSQPPYETSRSSSDTSQPPYDTSQPPYDVIVVGAGAAGMAAAMAASKEGAERVALLDRENFLGGILRQCIHNGFGLTRFRRELTGPEYASREAAKLADSNVELFLDTTVLSHHSFDEIAGLHKLYALNNQGLHLLQAKAVVLATGSRERGLGALNLAGSRPAGVFSAGSAQALINLEGCLPGRKVLIQGSGDIGLIMARRCLFAGAEVLGVFARSSKPSGLKRNVQQCLDDFGIPFFGNRVATRLEGEGRLKAVWVSSVDPATKQVIEGSEERWECDTLLLSIGLLPENEVALTAGVELNESSGGPLVDSLLETSVPGIFSAGNSLHIHDLADYASEEGEQAGRSAALFALHNGLIEDKYLPKFGKDADADAGADAEVTPDAEADAGTDAKVTPAPESISEPDLDLTCVRCPKGCELFVLLNEDGSIKQVTGEGCRLGLEYAEEEVHAPKRIVTASLSVADSLEPVSVKTAKAVPREMIFKVLEEARLLELKAPLPLGTVLIENVANTGIALKTTKAI